MIKKWGNAGFLMAYCNLIFWLSSQSSLPSPLLFSHQDKVIHLGAYFIMGILAWRFFNDYINSTDILICVSLSYCSLYGISDEWHQSFVPGRNADYLDWVADTLGASLALSFLYFRNSKRIKPRQ